MENQFATLTKSYYDNFLEYKLTGNESNQKAYMSAEQGIQSILNGLNDEVNAQSNSIASFYQSDVQGKLKSMSILGLEDQKEMTYFMLACPHVRR
jgi:hypothetical protein